MSSNDSRPFLTTQASIDEQSSSVSIADVTAEEMRIAALLDEFEARHRNGSGITAERFLEQHHEFAEPLRECLEGLQLLRNAGTASTSKPSVLQSGTRLGDFEVEQPIGGGAMGIVYQARQTSLAHTVALKVLSPSPLRNESRIERFRREVLAVSSLDHPNIVPVYQVGEDSGLYYYAMRKIDGHSLDGSKWSAECQPYGETDVHSYRRLAAALADVADALHSAHQQGIVHRDVKPSNLIRDRSGRIWLVDFGLAQCGSFDTLTQSGDVVGTLRYMSPEQSRGRSDQVDGRTDVYGIGATLYELLGGVPLFAGFEGIDLLRQIQHAQPTPLRRLRPKLPADLATIVQRAMRPDKSDRYESAAALSEDLRRFAVDKRITARPVSLTERGVHWTRSHVPSVLASLGLLVVGLAAALVHNHMLRDERNQTRLAVAVAEENYSEARRAVDQFGVRFAKRLLEIPGTESLRRDVLAETLGYYERFVASSQDDPRLRLDVVQTRLEIARLHTLLGDQAHAHQCYLDAVAALEGPQDRETRLVWERAINELAMLLSDGGKHAEARTELDRIAFPPDIAAQDGETRMSVALTLNNLAIVSARQKRTEDAILFLRRAIRTLSGGAARGDSLQRTNPRLQERLADAMSNLSAIMSDQQRQAEALALAKQAVILRNSLPDEDAASMQHRAIAHSNLAAILMRTERTTDAIASFRTAAGLLRNVRESRPQDPLVANQLAVTLNNLAMATFDEQDAPVAEAFFCEARRHVEAAIEQQPGHPSHRSTAAGIMNNLGVLRRDGGDLANARLAFESALRHQKAAAMAAPAESDANIQLSRIERNLASMELTR